MYRKLSSLALLAIIIFSMVGVTQASDAQSVWGCYQPSRLNVGGLGRVTTYPNLPNRVRSIPSFNGRVLGYIPAGATFNIIGGSQCASGINWWQVNYNGIIGWTGEGDGNYTYWLEPAGIVPPLPVSCALPNRLTVGGLGRVTPGLPNVVRSAPGTQRTGANSYVIGQIPGGGVFAISGGPQCGTDGRWWWYVDYNGLIGWTAEGEGYNNYWLEPWYNSATTCPYFLPSRLTPGGWGRINQVPYNPVVMYSTSSFGASVVGQIPRYGTFNVITGPYCGDNTAWWQVNYNGYVGWVVEGNGSSYWLEPT